MIKVGILGGTFDPVHYGHIALGKAALEQYGLNEVRFMTGGNPPHKKDLKVTSARDRHNMVSLALEGQQGLKPFDYEVDKTTYSYTARTLTELEQLHPDWEIYFIIGEDSLRDIFKWYQPEVVMKSCILLVYPRESEATLDELIKETSAKVECDIRKINAPLWNVSSTEIRKLVSEQKEIDEFIPQKVKEYIIENGLYRL